MSIIVFCNYCDLGSDIPKWLEFRQKVEFKLGAGHSQGLPLSSEAQGPRRLEAKFIIYISLILLSEL